MSAFPKAAVLAAAFVLAAHGAAAKELWRPYQDLDGQTRYVAFAERSTTESNKPLAERTLTEFQGYADVKNAPDAAFDRLGDLSVLVNAEGAGLAAIFNIGKRSYNPHRPEDAAELARARSFDFYEFGMQRLSHGRYTAPNGICQDFRNGSVHLSLSTSYYPDNSFTDYYTSHIEAELSAPRSAAISTYRAAFTGSDTRLQQQIRELVSQYGQQVAEDNVREKLTVLRNALCR